MKTNDVVAVLGIAGATAVMVLVLVGPGLATAVDEGAKAAPEIARPKLLVDGCTITLKTDKASYKAGETPTIEIEAVNSSQEAVELPIELFLSAQSAMSAVSRMGPVSRQYWTRKCILVLKPGERKTMAVAADAGTPANSSISLTVRGGKSTIVAASFSTMTPGRALNGMALQMARPANQAAQRAVVVARAGERK